jgi:catechol 2,3-dioxygenase-like lactoylglutathione lyase family enzyme
MNTAFRSSRDVIIRTNDWAAASTFYTATLGFEAVYRGDKLIGFETGSFRLYVEKGAEHAPVFDFLVADVQAAKAALLAAGCTLVEEDADVPRCYVRDPYGVTFNIGEADANAGAP